MTTGTPFFLLEQTPFDAGQSVPGAELYFYQTGTTTDQSVYTTPDLSAAHSQPVTADASGFFDPIYLNPNASVDYRARLEDGDGNLIWQRDAVPRFRENFQTDTFEVTYVGFSSDPANTTATWFQIGRLIYLSLPIGTGTSNSTQFTMSGLPSAIRPATTQYGFVPYAEDNSAFSTASIRVTNSSVISLAPGGAAYDLSGWTNSGTKGLVQDASIIYRLSDT